MTDSLLDAVTLTAITQGTPPANIDGVYATAVTSPSSNPASRVGAAYATVITSNTQPETPSDFNLLDLSPYWWFRGKDFAGVSGATINAADFTDASGNSRIPTSVASASVVTAGTTRSGKAINTSGLISLPSLISALTAPSSGLTGKVAVSSMFNSSYNGDELVNAANVWGWASNAAPSVESPQWATFGPFTGGRVIQSYQIKDQGNSNRSPKDWKFQGSNDTSGPWTDLDVRSGIASFPGQWRSYSFANSTPYLYYRLLVTATFGNDIIHLEEMTFDRIPNGGFKGAEFWVVYKGFIADASAWNFGSDSQANHYTYLGTVYSDFGTTLRDSYAPYWNLGEWTIIRCRATLYEGQQEWINGSRLFSSPGKTLSWTSSPALWTASGPAHIAEAFFTPELTDAQANEVYNYLNNEHGLSVAPVKPTFATTVPVAPSTVFWGSLANFLLGSSGPTTVADKVKALGPTAYYRFEQYDGDPNFVSEVGGLSRAFPIISGPSVFDTDVPASLGGKAWVGNGSTYGSLGSPPWFAPLNAFTIACWFKTNATGNRALFTMDNNFSSPGSANRKMSLYVSSGTITFFGFTTAGGFPFAQTTDVFNNNVWHQVIATRAETPGTAAQKIYVDGVLKASQNSSGVWAGTNVTAQIGQIVGTLNMQWSGRMDELVFFDREFSPTEAVDLYNIYL